MSLIKTVLSRILHRKARPSRPQPGVVQYPLGLSADQVASLRQLSSTPQWRSLSEALEAVCEREMQAILGGLPQEQYQLKCGKVQALMDVLTLPETIDLKAQELDDHARRTTDVAPGKRNLTFFGSPLWSPSRPPNIHGPDGMASADGRPSRLG